MFYEVICKKRNIAEKIKTRNSVQQNYQQKKQFSWNQPWQTGRCIHSCQHWGNTFVNKTHKCSRRQNCQRGHILVHTFACSVVLYHCLRKRTPNKEWHVWINHVSSIAVAFATSSGSGGISSDDKYNKCTSLICFTYSANSSGFQTFISPERTSRETTYFPLHPRFYPWVLSHDGSHCIATLNLDWCNTWDSF